MDEGGKHGHALMPSHCVGVDPQEDYGERFEDKLKRLVSGPSRPAGRRCAARLRDHRTENLRVPGFGVGR